MSVTDVLLPGATALIVSLLMTLAAERVAPRLGVVARPTADRWHRETIPLLGGLAIAVATAVPVLLGSHGDRRIAGLMVAALVMAAIGLVDDLRRLSPNTKLVAQIMLAATLSLFGFTLRLTGNGILDFLVTVFWIVGVSNAFNLLDNIDGLSSAVALVAASFRLMFFAWEHSAAGVLASAAFMGATSGFLVRNFPPAKIFMGDAGSLFIGFFLAGLCLLETDRAYSRGMVAVLVVPVLTLLVPIFDTTFVTLTRLLAGRSPAVGGRDHTSHRLIAVGLSERRTVVVLAALSALFGGVAVLSYESDLAETGVLLALLLLVLILLGVYLNHTDVSFKATPKVTPAARVARRLADLPYKRQVASLLLDVCLIVLAYYAAYVVRFESDLPLHRERLYGSLPIILAIQLPALAAFGLYRSVWRYTSVGDGLRVVKAVTISVVLTVVALVYTERFEGFSRMVFVLDWLLLIVLVVGTRSSFRLFEELFRTAPHSFTRVLVYGAGAGGELVVREMLNNPELGRLPVGFIDDDRSKHQARIHGLPVLGAADRLDAIVSEHRVTEVVVSSAKISGPAYEHIVEACERQGVPLRRVSVRFE